MPIVGSFAGASSRAYGLQAGLIGDFESIATVTAGSAVSNIEITSIPNTYQHLQIRMIHRVTSAGETNITLRFNDDTANNYSAHWVYGDGSTVSFGGVSTSNLNIPARTPGAAQTANCFGVAVIDILDYKDTNKYKTFRSLTGWDANGSGSIYFTSANWRSTSAITSLKFTDQGGGNLAQYTSVALYGIKG